MSEASTFLEQALFNHVLRATGYSSPTPRLALYTSTATTGELEAGTQTNEIPNSNAYARQAVTFGAPTDGSGSNSSAVTFPVATPSGWGTIRFGAVVDSATHNGGNVLVYTQLDADVVIGAGNQFQFNAGAFVVTFA